MIERTKKRRAKNKTSPATVDAREETELKATDCAVARAETRTQEKSRGDSLAAVPRTPRCCDTGAP